MRALAFFSGGKKGRVLPSARYFLLATFALALTSSAFATDDFKFQGSTGVSQKSYDWNASTNWSNGAVPGPAANYDINITNHFLESIVITNVSGGTSGSGLNFLRIISIPVGAGAGSNITLVTSGNLMTSYGFQIGSNATLVIANTATFGIDGNSSFDLNTAGQGTMIISNNGKVIVNFNAAIANGGTIIFNDASTGQSTLNYGQNNGVADFQNGTAGTIVQTGTGGGLLEGQFGTGAADTNGFINNGTIQVNGGSLEVDAGNVAGGFTNSSSGTITVASGTSFLVERTSAGWGAGDLINQGVMSLSNATIEALLGGVAFTNGAQNNGSWQNQKVISGWGTIEAPYFATSTSTQQAIGGTLTWIGTVYNPSAGSMWIATNTGSALQFSGLNADRLAGGTLLNSNGTVSVTNQVTVVLPENYFRNDGTLAFANGTMLYSNVTGLANFTNSATGVITGYGTFQTAINTVGSYGILNQGLIQLTNGTSSLGVTQIFQTASSTFGFQNSGNIQINTGSVFEVDRWGGGSGNPWLTASQQLTNSGTVTMNGGIWENTDLGSSLTGFAIVNTGTISGNGTLLAAMNNSGTINASGGTLTISSTNLDAGVLTSVFTQTGTLEIQSGSWLNISNSSGLVNFTNGGVITNLGGTLTAGVIINTGTIKGFGTINGSGGITNSGTILADATLLGSAAQGTLTLTLNGVTNTAQIGTIGTNTVLNLLGVNNLVNATNGVISISGGTIEANGTALTITNLGVLAGVGSPGNVVNVGSAASFIAQNPISGLSNLTATVGTTNSGILGGNSGATLQLTVTSLNGSTITTNNALVNSGTMEFVGGWITNVAATAGGGTGFFAVTNNSGGLIYGSGTQNLVIVNQAGAEVLASNGLLKVGMGAVNAGVISNANASSTLDLTNKVLVNTGNIYLNGGGLIMGGSSLTNDGIITGPGYYSSGLVNDTAGVVNATGGLLAIATNGPTTEVVSNVGTINIQSGGTLQVGGAANVDWNNQTVGSATGEVIFSGGYLSGGNLTNQGVVSGFGTNLESFVNLAGGSVFATNGVLGFNGSIVSNAGFMTIGNSTGGGTLSTLNAWANTGTITNNGNINSATVTNSGTIITTGSNNGTLNTAIVIGNGGYLIASNGAKIFMNGAATLTSSGTISLSTGSFVDSSAPFINGGNVVANTGTFGNNADSTGVINGGNIIANSGTFWFDTFNSYSSGGLNISNVGTLTINSGATFVLERNGNAWDAAAAGSGVYPTNNGYIVMNGGTLTVAYNNGQAPDREIINNGTIVGSGTLAVRIGQSAAGITIASNGVMNILQTIAGKQQMFTNLTGSYGNFEAATSGTLRINGTLATGNTGKWLVNSGGTLDLNGNSVDLGSANLSASNLNGTVLIGTGANLTLSSAAGGQTYGQNGTFAMSGGNVFYVDSQNLQAFTNAGWITGNGTFTTGYSTGAAGEYSVINQGTILANAAASSLLVFQSAESTNNPGFVNGTTGFIQVNTNASMFIDRYGFVAADAWNTANNLPTNQGTIFMNGGTLAMTDLGSSLTGFAFANASTGIIQGNGTIAASVQNGGTITAQGGTLTLFNATNTSTAYVVSNFNQRATGILAANSGGTLVISNQTGLIGFSNPGTISAGSSGTIIAGVVNNSGSIQFGGGNLSVTTLTNLAAGNVVLNASNNGTLAANTLVNLGTVALANGQTLTYNGSVFSNASTGVVLANGGNLVTTGSYVNVSTASGSYNFGNGTLDFAGAGTKVLLAGSTDLGQGFSATNNNFMIGNLADTNTVTLQLTSAAYVNNLDLYSGTTINLNGFNLYFASSTNIAGVTITGGTSANIIMLANIFTGGQVTFTNVTVAGTYDYENLTNFDAGFTATNSNMQVFIGSTSANNITVTQNTAAAAFTVQSMTVSNAGSGVYTLVLGRNQTWSSNSLEGTHGIVQISPTVTLTLGASNTVTSGGVFEGAGTISGGTLVVAAGGTVLATNIAGSGIATQYWTSATAPVLNANGTNMVAASSVLRFAAAVNNGGAVVMNGGTLVTDNTLTNLSGGVISGGGEVIVSGGTVVNASGGTVIGNNSGQALDFAGAQTVGNFGVFEAASGGTLSFGGGSTIVTNAGTVELVNGTVASGNLTNLAAGTISGAGTITGTVINQGTIESTNGTMVLVSNPVLTGTANVRNGGTLQFGATGALLTVTNSGTISLYGGNVIGGSVYNQGNISTITNGGLISNLVNSASGFVNATNGTLTVLPTLANAGVISNTATLTVGPAGASSVTNSGTLAFAGGTMNSGSITNVGTVAGNGTLTGSLVNGGTVSASGGVLNLATGAGSTITNSGTVGASAGGTLSVTPAWNNAGTINLNGGLLSGGNVTNANTVVMSSGFLGSSTLVNNGTVTASAGTNNIYSTTVVQNGTMIGGGTPQSVIFATNQTTLAGNSGTLLLNSAAGQTNLSFVFYEGPTGAGTFTNSASGLIQGSGYLLLGTFVGGGKNYSIVNQGNIVATNGALIVQPGDAFSGAGFENLAGGTVTVASASTFGIHRTDNAWNNDTATNSFNQGVINMNGGSFTLYDNVGGLVVSNQFVFSNAVGGVISGSGTMMASLNNQGTINATNGNLNINNGTNFVQNGTISIQSGGTLTVLGLTTLTNAGQALLYGGTLSATNVGQNGNSFFNTGTLAGEGVVQLGVSNAINGANAHLLNTGNLIATNWGGATPGTLFITTGNAFSGGGFENLAGGTVQVATNMTLTINRSENAWATSGNAVTNLGQIALGGGTLNFAADGAVTNAAGFINNGSITGFGFVEAALTNASLGTIAPSGGTLTMDGSGGFGNSGTILVNTGNALMLTNVAGGTGLSFTNAGIILMQGGLLQAGVISSTNTIQGYGTIAGGGVANSGTLLANATSLSSVGTLTVTLTSYTNGSTATLGVVGTNSILNVLTPNATPYLVNLGTIVVSGGTITNTQAGGMVISNLNVISGVGTLSSVPVVNGAGSSIIAQNPTQGFSNFYASVSPTNVSGSTFGANGGATLALTTSNGVGLVNNGTIELNGGFISVNNGASEVTNLNGQIYGSGLQSNLNVVNLSGGSVVASNGTLRFGMLNNSNKGVLSNFSSTATLLMTNTVLVNNGKIQLNGGGLVMGGSVITNEGLIQGPGNYSSGLYNDTAGSVVATNGTLAIATNGPATEAVVNLGSITIWNASTLQVGGAGANAVTWNNTNGTVTLLGGSLAGGSVTNNGTILGNGTIVSGVNLYNAAGGTVQASNGALVVSSTTVTQSGTMIGGTASGTYIQITNMPTMFVNSGTMVLGSAAGQTNVGFYVLENFTNAASGLISGAGILRTGDGKVGGGGNNLNIFNAGTIAATNGTLIVDMGDAFSAGFNNLASGTVTVANASTFGISRSTNAWLNSGFDPYNSGAILLNGGVVATYTNTGTGVTATPVLDTAFTVSNAVAGVISGNGTLNMNLVNLGTVNATNGTLVLAGTAAFNQNGTLSIQNGATFTTLQTTGNFQNNGTISLLGGTFVGTNFGAAAFVNAGTVSGNGAFNSGALNVAGGENIINVGGTIIATNGTLLVNAGDAFNGGGFSNAVNSTVVVANNGTLELNRTVNAWNNTANANPRNLGAIKMQGGSFVTEAGGVADASRAIINVSGGSISGSGTISATITNANGALIDATGGGTLALAGTGAFQQAGTLEVDANTTMLVSNATAGLVSFANTGTINMNGGTLVAGAIANSSLIFGNGTIAGSGVANSGYLLASNGQLFTALSSFTNASTATIGTLSTNAEVNVQIGAGQPLINQGTISMQGGTLLFNSTPGGVITNNNVVVGVGDMTANTIVNNGTVLAANPVSGITTFSVGLSPVNSANIGASNNATLNVVVSGGTIINNGTVAMVGGSLTVNGGTGGTITNNNVVSGVGTVTPGIYNNGTVEATVAAGVLDVTFNGGTNISTGNLDAGFGATVQVEGGLYNQGTIGPVGVSGGTIQMAAASGIITNQGTINGTANLAFNSFVQNNSIIYATNGTVNFNALAGLANAGTINVANGGTFQSNSSNSWANTGSIDMRGGTLRTGGWTASVNSVSAIFTNTGSIDGFGTIIGGGADGLASGTAGADKTIVNLGTITVTNFTAASQTLFITSGSAQSQGGIQNLGNMIVSSNNTLSLNRQAGEAILNQGTITIQNGTLTGSGILSNDLGGVIQGYGTLTFAMVNTAGGTIRATNGLMSMTGSVVPINAGTMEIDGGATLTWDATNSWQNNGTIDLIGGTLRTGGPTNAFAGGEPFTNDNYMVGFGTIIGGGAFETNGSGIDKAIINLGTIVADGGTLVIDTGDSVISNGIANFGTMIVSNATDTLDLRRRASGVNNNFIINTGTIQINGGTLTANTAITNQYISALLPGVIQGYGTIALTNQLVNSGTILSTNGVLYFSTPTGGSELNVQQSGELEVAAGSQMIFGSDSNAPVANSGSIQMNGGFFRSGFLTNSSGALIQGGGTMTPSIINAGTLMAQGATALNLMGSTILNTNTGYFGANNGQLIVNTVFTNAGTVSFMDSIGTFNSTVVNKGAWISDPSTNIFNSDYFVATNGYISMAKGDDYIFKSNFVNVSSLTNKYNTLQGQFTFNNNSGYTQSMYVAGLNLGGWASSYGPSNEQYFSANGGTFSTNSYQFAGQDIVEGYSNNFALGTLQVGDATDASTLELADSFAPQGPGVDDGKVAALYLNTLTLDPGSLLIISNNVELYFQTTNGVTGLMFGVNDGSGNILLLNGASFHELTIVPEPSILMLLSIGSMAMFWFRRRRAKSNGKQ